MHFSTVIPLFLTSISIILPTQAASHGNLRGVHRRRHAARANAGDHAELKERGDECTNGAWKCVGTELHRESRYEQPMGWVADRFCGVGCYYAGWHMVQNCTGENIICS